jgi:vacuolar-type H+-ATPase subunit I/STV1
MKRELILSELSVEDLESLKIEEDGSLDEVYVEKSKKLTTENRNTLKDSDFALIQQVKNKTTGKMEPLRRFPISDEAHVRNALARLPLAKNITPEEKALVEKRILAKAKELGMADLLNKHGMEKSKVTSLLKKAAKKISTSKKCAKKATEESTLSKSKLEKFVNGVKKFSKKIKEARVASKAKDMEISTLKVELEKSKLIPKVEEPIKSTIEEPKLETASLKVGDVREDNLDEHGKRIKKIREQSNSYLNPVV